jgi:hypothetical protein
MSESESPLSEATLSAPARKAWTRSERALHDRSSHSPPDKRLKYSIASVCSGSKLTDFSKSAIASLRRPCCHAMTPNMDQISALFDCRVSAFPYHSRASVNRFSASAN